MILATQVTVMRFGIDDSLAEKTTGLEQN
jgi:hypothetical protein